MDFRRHCIRASTLGTIAWAGWLALFDPPLAQTLLCLSPLVIAPLLLRAVAATPTEQSRAWKLAVSAQLPAAGLATASFALPSGILAASMTLPWGLVTVAMALHGLWRILGRRRLRPVGHLAIDAGLALPVIGAGWWAMSRLGYAPLDFSPTIVLLTAVHFHYAGFVLPIVAGLGALRLQGRSAPLAAAGVVAGVPLVALGITFSPELEVAAAFLTAGSALFVGVGQIRCGLARGGKGGVLHGLSGLALVTAMGAASLYAFGEFVQRPWPSIPQMIAVHGALNALGFGLLGAWAWNMEDRPK